MSKLDATVRLRVLRELITSGEAPSVPDAARALGVS